jgi:hypothetical protein
MATRTTCLQEKIAARIVTTGIFNVDVNGMCMKGGVFESRRVFQSCSAVWQQSKT